MLPDKKNIIIIIDYVVFQWGEGPVVPIPELRVDTRIDNPHSSLSNIGHDQHLLKSLQKFQILVN